MENPTMLVLWDIDMTLVDMRGLGVSWYERALEEVLGVRLRTAPSFPGCTERSITSELLRAHGVEPTERLIQRMFDRLVEIADEQSGSLAERGSALPGAAAALEALRPQVEQSLVTGNLRAVAERKLAAFSLERHVDLDIGGYGAISEQRADLVAAAMANASAKH
ncbi:MAG: HAD family hydrolase, partial [Sciscionella sp.]